MYIGRTALPFIESKTPLHEQFAFGCDRYFPHDPYESAIVKTFSFFSSNMVNTFISVLKVQRPTHVNYLLLYREESLLSIS